MDFTLSHEEAMLRDSVARFVTAEYELPKRHALIAEERDHWDRFAELGWLGLGIPEEAGGYDPAIGSLMLVAEALGGGLALEPYVGLAVLTPQVLLAALGAEAAAPLLAPLIAGEERLALANMEADARGRLAFIRATAAPQVDGYVLAGAKAAVIGGPRATAFLVAARTAGVAGDPHGISLFRVERDAPGLTVLDYRMIDDSPVADLVLDQVQVAASARIGEEGGALPALAAGTDIAIVATAFASVGAMAAALDQTCDYLRTRKQFGNALSQFQVLRHRAADMLVELEQARSAAWRGLAGLHAADPAARARAASAARIVTARAAHFVCGQAIQLHGGMGVTDELRISHLFKHATVNNNILGSPAHHVQRMGETM